MIKKFQGCCFQASYFTGVALKYKKFSPKKNICYVVSNQECWSVIKFGEGCSIFHRKKIKSDIYLELVKKCLTFFIWRQLFWYISMSTASDNFKKMPLLKDFFLPNSRITAISRKKLNKHKLPTTTCYRSAFLFFYCT